MFGCKSTFDRTLHAGRGRRCLLSRRRSRRLCPVTIRLHHATTPATRCPPSPTTMTTYSLSAPITYNNDNNIQFKCCPPITYNNDNIQYSLSVEARSCILMSKVLFGMSAYRFSLPWVDKSDEAFFWLQDLS